MTGRRSPFGIERAATKRPVSWVTLLGVATLPALIGGVLVAALYEPTDNLQNMTAAIVNDDEGTEIDGQFVPLGRQLSAGLVDGTDELDSNLTWVISNSDDAASGLADGSYEAVITIPAEFSKAATSAGTTLSGGDESPEQATIAVTTADDAPIVDSAVSAQLANAAASTIGQTLSETTMETVFVGYRTLGEQLGTAADGATEIAGGGIQLENGATEITDGTRQLGDGIGLLGDGATQLADGAGQLADGATQAGSGAYALADGAQQVAAGGVGLQDGAAALANGTGGLAGGARSLADAAQQAVPGAGQLADGAEQSAVGAADLAAGAHAIAVGANQSAGGAASLAEGARAAGTGADELATGATSLAEGATALADGSNRLATGADELSAGLPQLTAGLTQSRDGATALESALNAGADDIAANGIVPLELQQAADGSATAASGVQAGLQQLNDSCALSGAAAEYCIGVAELLAASEQNALAASGTAAGLTQLASEAPTQLESGYREAAAGAGELAVGLESLHAASASAAEGAAALGEGARGTADGAGELSTGAASLADGSASLASGIGELAGGAAQLETGVAAIAEGSTALAHGADQLAAGGSALRTGASALADGVAQLAGGAVGLADGADAAAQGAGALAGGAGQLGTGAAGLATGADELAAGVTALATGANGISDGAGELASGTAPLADGVAGIGDGVTQLGDGAGGLATGATGLAEGLDEAVAQLPSFNDDEAKSLASVLANPVSTDTGSGTLLGNSIVPLFVGVVLWFGSLATFVALRPYSAGALASRSSSATLTLRGLAPAGAIGAIQGVIAAIVVQAFIREPASTFFAILGVSVAIGIAFAAVNQALVAAFGGIGRWIAALVGTVAVATGIVSTSPQWLTGPASILPVQPARDALVAALSGATPAASFVALATWAVLSLIVTVISCASQRRARAVDDLAPVSI